MKNKGRAGHSSGMRQVFNLRIKTVWKFISMLMTLWLHVADEASSTAQEEKKNSTWITVIEIIFSFCSHWRGEKKKEITFSGPRSNRKNHHALRKLCRCVICLLVLDPSCWGPGIFFACKVCRNECIKHTETFMSNFYYSTIKQVALRKMMLWLRPPNPRPSK